VPAQHDLDVLLLVGRCTCAARHRSAYSAKAICPAFGSTYCPVTTD